jgi:LysM repeat protein
MFGVLAQCICINLILWVGVCRGTLVRFNGQPRLAVQPKHLASFLTNAVNSYEVPTGRSVISVLVSNHMRLVAQRQGAIMRLQETGVKPFSGGSSRLPWTYTNLTKALHRTFYPPTYTVVPGDTLYLISQKLGISLSDLERANPQVAPPNFVIQIGQVLNLPGGSSSTPYTVVSGDTLYLISQRLGISLSDLENANPQVTPPNYALQIGQVLNIPGNGPRLNPGGPGSNGPNYTPGHDNEGGPGAPLRFYSGPASAFPGAALWQSYNKYYPRQVAQMNSAGNTPQQTQWVLDAVQQVSSESNIDKRVILAMIMQESHGQVTVGTTNNGVLNTGIMQAHNGAVYDPANPRGSILQMVRDGVEGVSGPNGGDGLKQLLQRYGNVFVAFRGYNSGDGGINFNDLSAGNGATNSYVSDIANRLMGSDPN